MAKEFTTKGLFQSVKAGCALGLLVVLSTSARAQYNLSLNTNSIAGNVAGPSIEAQTGVFALNTSKGSTVSNIKVTASLSDQTYSNVAHNGTGTGLQFGASQNTIGVEANAQNVWSPMQNVSSPSNEIFNANALPDIATIDVADNYAFSLFSTTRPLAAQGLPASGRYFMGQLTITFSQPVDNPVVHLVGLGATVGDLGISTELEIVNQGIILTKLNGNENLTVSDKQILNSAAQPDASSHTGAATGSILASATNISSLTFKVYLKGDGAANEWEKAGQYNGDRWMIGVSVNGESKLATNTQVLPIYITNFNVIHDADCAAHLRWKTNTELGISDFFIEHSIDGVSFNEIYTMPSRGAAEGDYYSWSYNYAASGANFFRIRTKDIMSDSNYSPIVKVLVTCKEPTIEAFPNPAQDFLKVRGVSAGNTIQLSNMFGKLMRNQPAESSESNLDLHGLQPGIYVLVVTNERGEEIARTRINKQ